MMEQAGQQQPQRQPQGQPQGKEMPPALKKKVTAYNAGISQMLHNPKTRNGVYEMLKGGQPEVDIPKAAIAVNKQMEKAVSKEGKPSLTVLLQGGLFTVGELIDIGHAGGFFQLEEQDVGLILQDTIQQYIETGLKDKSIDPVELQEAVEPLLNEEQRGIGAQVGQQAGMDERPGTSAAMEKYAGQQVARAEKRFSDKAAGEAKAQRSDANRQPKQQQPQGFLQQQGGA